MMFIENMRYHTTFHLSKRSRTPYAKGKSNTRNVKAKTLTNTATSKRCLSIQGDASMAEKRNHLTNQRSKFKSC